MITVPLVLLSFIGALSHVKGETQKGSPILDDSSKLKHARAENHPTDNSSGQGLASLTCSAISDLVKVNGNKLPSSFSDLVSLLDRHGSARGGVERVVVPFSQAPGSSGLGRPRVLIKVASAPNGNFPDRDNKKHLNLNNRFFAALTSSPDGSQTLEFISWNKRKKAFDFGVIENFNNPSKRKVISDPAKTQQCLTCHKTGGPIFPVAPWSTTADGHGATQMAMIERLAQEDPQNYKTLNATIQQLRRDSETATPSERLQRLSDGRPVSRDQVFRELLRENPVVRNARLIVGGENTGLRLFDFSNLDINNFDSSVRTANDHLNLHQATNSLKIDNRRRVIRDGIRALAATLLSNTQGEGQRTTYDRTLTDLVRPALTGVPAYRSTNLRSFSPSTGQELADETVHDEASSGNEQSIKRILGYDTERKAGRTRVLRGTSPTEAESYSARTNFQNRDILKRFGISTALNPFSSGLANVLGITEADRTLLRSLLPHGAQVSEQEVINRVLSSPQFEQLVLLGDGFPTREQFIRYLAKAIRDEGKKTKSAILPEVAPDYLDHLTADDECLVPDSTTASNGGIGGQAPAPTSGNCRSCHVGEQAVKRLPFDPENRTEWIRWLNSSNARERDRARAFLSETVRRLKGEGDRMPPSDSDEARTFSANQRRELIEFLESQQ